MLSNNALISGISTTVQLVSSISTLREDVLLLEMFEFCTLDESVYADTFSAHGTDICFLDAHPKYFLDFQALQSSSRHFQSHSKIGDMQFPHCRVFRKWIQFF